MIKELKGRNGKFVGSNEYIDSINSKYLYGLMPKNKGRNRYFDLYIDILKKLHDKKYAYVVKMYKLTPQNSKNSLRKLFDKISSVIVGI